MTSKKLGCPECAIIRGGLDPRGIAPVGRGVFVVHPRDEDAAVPGWIVVAPVRHVEQWDELSPRELAEIGPLLAKVTAALRAETGAEKIYVSVFAEVLAHLHVHVIARTKDVPVESRGPRIFLSSTQAESVEATRIGTRVLERLRAKKRPAL